MLYISISPCISHRQLNKVIAQLDLLKSLFDHAGGAKHGHAHFNLQAALTSLTEGLCTAAQVSKCGLIYRLMSGDKYCVLYSFIELGDIPVFSLHRDKNPTSRNDISIAFARYYRFLRKLLVRVVKLMRELHAHDRLKEQLFRCL